MARLPRYFVEGQPQNIIQRGNNREPIFVVLEAIRTAINTGWALGNDRFREKIEHLSGRRTVPKSRDGPRKAEERVN